MLLKELTIIKCEWLPVEGSTKSPGIISYDQTIYLYFIQYMINRPLKTFLHSFLI